MYGFGVCSPGLRLDLRSNGATIGRPLLGGIRWNRLEILRQAQDDIELRLTLGLVILSAVERSQGVTRCVSKCQIQQRAADVRPFEKIFEKGLTMCIVCDILGLGKFAILRFGDPNLRDRLCLCVLYSV